ncbi:MAG: ABC transporter substrate-binding protein [Bacteroidota bacterium]
MKFKYIFLVITLIIASCSSPKKEKTVPVVAFLDAFEDETVGQAKNGFFDALEKNGFSEKDKTLEVIYRNAQGDMTTMGQAIDYFLAQDADLIATNATISTIAAVQKQNAVPVCMMVSPSVELMQLTDKRGKSPQNLFGVYETLSYIDTSVALIKKIVPTAKKLGLIYNQAEPQSVNAFYKISEECKRQNLAIEALPVNNSSETQQVVQALLAKQIDCFFAMPDNTVFSSFETIVKTCNEKNVPVFTSESGLVKRGAVAAYGADMYLWGYQSGEEAVKFLKNKNLNGLIPVMVKARKVSFNKEAATKLGISITDSIANTFNQN